MIRRKIAIALLAAGTVAGYAAGFASMHHRMECRRDRFERHVAKVCVEAAKGQAAPTPAAATVNED